VRRLLARSSVRRAEGAFVVEGAGLLAAALDADADVLSVFVDSGSRPGPDGAAVIERAHARGARVFELAPGVMARVADTVTPQPVLGVVRRPDWGGPAAEAEGGSGPLVAPGSTFVVVCAQVRDPGNAGTVIRSADAAGADAVVFCEQSVDPFNPKTVRAAAGSVLQVPVVEAGSAAHVLEELGRAGLRRLGTTAAGGCPYTEADLVAPSALVFGNEAAGIPAEVGHHLDATVSIPMAGRAESLNVAMAASVLCFEVVRQRSARGL
jgi:RNA methyltransferase, TrmH family